MKIYHLAWGLLLTACAPNGPAPMPVAMVFDSDTMMAHRLAGTQTVVLPGAAEVPFDGFQIEVTVTSEGAVSAARALPGPLGGGVPASALAAAQGWRFRPFRYHGQAVPARGSISIGFRNLGGWRDPAAALPPIDYDRLVIRLERSACFGTCPDYAVTIDGHGDVRFASNEPGGGGRFNPMRGVLLPGVHRGHVDRAALDALIQRFRAAHFFGLRRTYQFGATDLPTYTLTFQSGGQSFTVTDYAGGQVGMPAAVTALEEAVDAAAGSARWVRGDGHSVAALRGEGMDFAGEEGARLAFAAALSQEAEDRFSVDLLDAGVPLERPFGSGAQRMPLGAQLLLAAVERHRLPLFAALARRGWLARVPRARLSQAFADGGGGCHPAIARALVAAGADPRARSRTSEPPGAGALQVAVRSYGVCHGVPPAPIVAALIALDVDVNAADGNGQTALFGVEDPDLQERLLAAGARADVRDKAGNSPAFSSWNDRIVRGLLDAGADPHAHYDDGHDLRRQAHERDMPSVLAWLDAHPERERAPRR